METCKVKEERQWHYIRSYPTYEEWKPWHKLGNPSVHTSSYPTYEEWKLLLKTFPTIYLFLGSYPTYEEWKLRHKNTKIMVS